VTWGAAPALIVPGPETKLKASYGTGFKAPTLTELYVNNLALIGRIDNLLNRQRERPVGFPRLGFGVLGGIRLPN
jgi:outer membrane receptor protein involved in Fe transport